MADRLTLFTLLGAADAAEAALKWPRQTFLPSLGLFGSIEQPSDYEGFLSYLNTALNFRNVLPGSDEQRVGLTADVVIDNVPLPMPVVFRQLPDFGFVLQQNTPTNPARLFVTRSDVGVEIVVEGVPVEIQLPNGLLGPLRSEAEEQAGPSLTDVVQGGDFQGGNYDALKIALREITSSSIFVHVRVRFTEEGEIVIEPAVPISIGACRFSGLPCVGVHDLGFLPYSKLTGEHTEHELALEWARHEIPEGLGTEGTGLITVRTLDLDHTRDPIRYLVGSLTDPSARSDVQFVLEDLALPVSSWLTPVATHGRFGLRRSVLTGGDEAEAYDLSLAPLVVNLSSVVDWKLEIFRLIFETPDTVIARMAVQFGTDSMPGRDQAMEVDISDGWLLQGAYLPPHPLHMLTLLNVDVSFMTVRLGILLRNLADAQGFKGFMNHVRVLADLGIKVLDGKDKAIQVKKAGQDTTSTTPTTPSTQPDVVLRNIGWDLGSPALIPDLWSPETLKLTAFEVVELDVEEVAFLNEDNGGRYLAFSGGVSLFPGAGDNKVSSTGTAGVPSQGQPAGAGLRFRRLRFLIDGNPNAPEWLLDGVGLFIRKGRFELSGSGSITDVSHDGHRYREFGLSLLVKFSGLGKDFSLGAQFYYGHVTGPVDNFTYWLFGAQFSYVPVGEIDLHGVRALAVSGMSPDLPEPTGRPQEMRLLDWYKQNQASGAVDVRSDRSQHRGGWKVERDAQAAGVGTDLCLSVSKALLLRAFIFMHTSDSGSGLLVVAEVFALKASQPIGTGAIEIDLDNDRVSAVIGVDLELAKLFNSDSALVKGLGRLTGTVFATNHPPMFAIGQLNDQTSWMTLSFNKSLLGAQGRVSIAFCLQIAGSAGPRGFGFAAAVVAKGSFGIGKVEFYAAFGFIAGVWGNEASSSGFSAWAEVALRIKVFWVFSFGAHVKAVIEQLGPQEPNYRRVSLEVRIETPWWLPDVTFRVEKVRDTPQPEAMPLLSTPVQSAGVLEPGSTRETPAALTDAGPDGTLHTITELRALPPGELDASAWANLHPVSVDATVALNFAVSVTNETTVVPTTPTDAGTQAAAAPAQNHLSATYTLVQIGIRRRARYGPDAGVWTDLLAPADSQVGDLEALANDPNLAVTFASVVRFRWDADVVRDNAMDPRRLLVNAETPYSFLSGNPAVDEGLLATDPAYPCCSGKRTTKVHTLDFVDTAFGQRTPATQRFTDSASTLRWMTPRPPSVAPAVGQPQGVAVARLLLTNAAVIGVVTFDEPALLIDLSVFWQPVTSHAAGVLVVEACRGLNVVSRQEFPLGAASPANPIRCADNGGLTSVTVRYVRDVDSALPPLTPDVIEVRNLRYRTVRDERARVADQARCRATGSVAGGGKLAWLPNHDYELAVTVRTTVDHQGSAQDAEIVQRAGFRTRGLPGLNAVEPGASELEPYVESAYPGPSGLLYRREPVVLAFDERFSTLLPVDRTPSPTDPAERTQLLEWVLAVSQGDGESLSVVSADWVVTHRGTAPPPRPRLPWIIDGAFMRADVRHAQTLNAPAQRLETLELQSPSCGLNEPRLHSSQVLVHTPADPAAPLGTADSLWPARTTLRAVVRAKAGPHVSRAPFEDGDETALTVADEGRMTSTGWQVVDGAVSVLAPAPGLRHYAVFGDDSWDHMQIHAELDPAGGSCGIAVAVAGLPQVDRALLALVDEAGGQLRLVARRAGANADVAAVPLPPRAAGEGPRSLTVLVFDDLVRAQVGDAVVEAARDDLRDGRVALVVDGPGRFMSLHVDGLDAYVSQLGTSRFASFEEHIGSWDGSVRVLPVDATGVAPLLAATTADIPAVMAPGADGQLRQRLFDRWVSELVLPVAGPIDGTRISSVADSSGTRLLLLESAEALPFSRDVRLAVTHRVTSLPPSPGIPKPLLRFAAGISFTHDVVRAPVGADVLAIVDSAAVLILAVRSHQLLSHTEYRIYRVQIRTLPTGAVLSGELLEVRQTPPQLSGSQSHPHPTAIPVDHVVLFDGHNVALTPPLPLPVDHIEEVAFTVLSNSAEDKVLLIPAAPMVSDDYTFTWSLDRARYRAVAVDDNTNYRASAVSTVILHSEP